MASRPLARENAQSGDPENPQAPEEDLRGSTRNVQYDPSLANPAVHGGEEHIRQRSNLKYWKKYYPGQKTYDHSEILIIYFMLYSKLDYESICLSHMFEDYTDFHTIVVGGLLPPQFRKSSLWF